MADFKIGKITHYYDKIGVAIVELDATLTTGDKIKFVRGGDDLFEQTVESIQIEHEKKESAKKGDVIGLKVEKEVKEGAEVYKLQ
jgi:putative protease